MSTASLDWPLLTEKQAAELLGVSPGTLSVWRCTRRYPIPYTKVGRCVRYRREQLVDYLESRTVGGTSAE